MLLLQCFLQREAGDNGTMTVTEFQILLDLHYGNEYDVLEEHASLTYYGYLFIDSENGQCYLFDKNGKIDDIKKMKMVIDVKKDIKKIVIPESVKRIGDVAFYSCTSLKSIEILESVEYIGYLAFDGCTSLEEIIFKGKTMDQVKAMDWYPWGIEDESIIKCS